MSSLRPLLGRTLVLVAHPDDEAVGCGALLQRIEHPIVVFATDGAPRSDFFWHNSGSREEYALVRAEEAKRALKSVGVKRFNLLCVTNPVVDQELYTELDRAYQSLVQLIAVERPDTILTMSYEGGHPDHDACSLLAAQAGGYFGVPVWEMPLYHRTVADISRQCFLDGDEGLELEISREELVRKMNMFAAYDSQSEVLRDFLPYIERFRPMKSYDFSQPPHSGKLNYETWNWSMKGSDLCQVFSRFVQNRQAKKYEWGTAA